MPCSEAVPLRSICVSPILADIETPGTVCANDRYDARVPGSLQ
jgi:hypothetical protein